MSDSRPRVTEISQIVEETPTVKTFLVSDKPSIEANPGQFVMVWVPGSGEIPLAISGLTENIVAITVKKRGETTEEMHGLEPGDEIGIRGPFGNGFSPPAGPSLIVGGGYGISPLRYFHQKFSGRYEISTIVGASTEKELLFRDELSPEFVTTDDGTCGFEGNVISPLETVLKNGDIEGVYVSGPERMIYRAYEMCRNREIKLEASLERIMKCGVGLCGSCLIDGFRVCQDGPVADMEVLAELEEFGNWERSYSGKREPI